VLFYKLHYNRGVHSESPWIGLDLLPNAGELDRLLIHLCIFELIDCNLNVYFEFIIQKIIKILSLEYVESARCTKLTIPIT
jgi:hypothetical protein